MEMPPALNFEVLLNNGTIEPASTYFEILQLRYKK